DAVMWRAALFPEHADRAAERQEAGLPAGAAAVGAADDFGAEADREHLDPEPGQSRHEIVTQLMDRNEDSRDRQKTSNVKQTCRGEFHDAQSSCRSRSYGRYFQDCIRVYT